MSIINSVHGRKFIVVCHRVEYLVLSSVIFSLMKNDLLTTCEIVNRLMIILYILIAEVSTKFKNI